MSFESSSPKFESTEASGLVGLAPVTRSLGTPKRNFLYNLMQSADNKLMNETIAAIYLHGDPTIQFGGYSPQAYPHENDLVTLRTQGANTWMVNRTSEVAVSGKVKKLSRPRQVLIDPGYPVIYIPEQDWNELE